MQTQTAKDPQRDFDFFIGAWRVHHKRLKARLAGSTEWEECEGTTELRTTLGGFGNMDDNVIDLPGGAYRAMTVRMFDPEAQLWSIWWFDSRFPQGPIEPPVHGRFENGVGTFLADDMLNGKPIKVRFLWSHIAANSARWEQAFSPDGGESWETNWTMEFTRTA